MVYGQLNRLDCRNLVLKERWTYATILVFVAETRPQRNLCRISLYYSFGLSRNLCRSICV